MRTATEKYHAVLEGKLQEAEFVRQMRQAYPQFITQWNGYKDSVSILKQKSLIFEKKEVKKDIDVLADQFPINVVERGIDAELEAQGIDSTGNVSKEDYMKARIKVIANLQKDANHYINLIAGESSKVDKHDQMVEPKKGNEVDVHNGLKKADLKENHTKPVNEYDQADSVADYIKKYYANPKTGKSLIDDEIINDFYKTHPEWEEQADGSDEGMQAVMDNFQEFLSVNYESGADYMQEKVAKSAEDVIDPADYGAIGQGYLKGFNKPHSLDADQLETLGRKVVDSLHKGDFDAAKAKFVKEAMSDDEMARIAKYGKDTDMKSIDKLYKLGQMFSSDFDYEGMLKAGLKVRLNTPIDKMQALFDSFEDVNYHTEGSHLSYAIDAAKEGNKAEVLDNLKKFRAAIKKTLSSFNEGVSKVRKQLEGSDPVNTDMTADLDDDEGLADVEEVINERVGSLQEFIALIQDRAEENDTSEREEAEEVMYAIGDHYNIGVDIMKGPWDDDNGVNEGRRRKTQGGKVVTENDYETGGYVESMGPLFDKGVNMLIKAWEEWKMGPMTEPGMIEFAKKDVLSYLETQFMVENLEEKKGTDHDDDGDIDKEDYMASKDAAIKKAMGKEKIVKENIKSIILKVLEEGVINEAATNALAEFSETYGGYEGMKQAIISLQDVVTDIESYYDKTRTKIQKVYDTLGDIRNEEGLKVGGFLAPAIEQAFNKDLRPAVKGGFTKGLNQPKVRVISQADIDAHNSGANPLGEEEKQNVFSPNTINGAL